MRTLEEMKDELDALRRIEMGLTGGLAELTHPWARHFWSVPLVLMQLAAVRAQTHALRWTLGEEESCYPLGFEVLMRAHEEEIRASQESAKRSGVPNHERF